MTGAPPPDLGLGGLRVLDLSSNLAGPLAAMVLGDLGADVVKVERLGTGDDTRSLPPRFGAESSVFLSVNRGKRSVELDLAGDAGREAVLVLAESADVMIESFGPGIAARLGLDFDAASARSRRIVYATVSAFGADEVGRTLPGYDSLIQSFSGMMSITGHPGAPPSRVAPSAVDLSTGQWLVIAILMALRRREDDDRAQHVEAALVDTAFNLMGHQLLGMLATGAVPEPLGSGSPSSMPNGAFAARDGWIVVATGNASQWRRMCEAVGAPQLLDDPRFASIPDRIAHREALQTELDERFTTETVDHWIERLPSARVPAGPINTLADAVEHPLMTERRLLVPVPGGDGEQLPQLRLPIDPEGAGVRGGPPRLGEHTEEVLRELGLSEEAIRGLRRATLVASDHSER